MTRRKVLEDLKEALENPHKSDADLNVTATQRIKGIFKENEYLRKIPPFHRGELCSQMRYIELNFLDTLTTDSVRKPDFFFLVSGRLSLRVRRNDEQILEQYDILGYTKPIDGRKWTPAKIIARERSVLLSIPRQFLKKQIEKLKRTEENTGLIDFIVKTVPGVRQLGQAGKERAVNLFDRVKFKTGDVILKEREVARYAFIIEKGECKLLCTEDPLKRPGSALNRGLMSKTTSCYNFGLVAAGEWIGEGSILFDRPMEFSVKATSNVSALRISREKLLDNLNKDTHNGLRNNLEAKMTWIQDRKANISSTIYKTVGSQDPSSSYAACEHTEKQYPKASKAALINIRRNELAKADYNARLALTSPNAGQSPGMISSPDDDQNPYQLQETLSRPMSQYSVRSFLTRPFSSYTNLNSRNKKRYTAQIKQSNASLTSDDSKTRLHSACTLGYSLVPTISKAKVTSTNTLHHHGHFGIKPPRIAIKNNNGAAMTYAQKVRKGKPISPNPAEVWARKHNFELGKNAPIKSNRIIQL